MGYSYGRTASGRMALCCDNCGQTGQVRKRICPYKVIGDNSRSADGHRPSMSYCYPPAVCPACWSTVKAKVHADCKAGAAKAQAEADATQARLDGGDLIVLAAWGDWDNDTPTGITRVCFGGPGGQGERMYLMPSGDYKGGGWLSDYPNAVPVEEYAAGGQSALEAAAAADNPDLHLYVEEPDGKYPHLVRVSCSCGSWRLDGTVNPVVGRFQHSIHIAGLDGSRPSAPVQEAAGEPDAPDVEAPAPSDNEPSDAVWATLNAATWTDGNLGTKRRPQIVHVLKLPAGRLQRPEYEAVRDVVDKLGGRWSRRIGGFGFAPPKLLWDGGPGEYTRSGRERLDEWLRANKPAISADVPATPVADTLPDEVIEENDTVQLDGERGHWVVDGIAAGLADISRTRGHERRGGMTTTQTTVSVSRLRLVRKGNKMFDDLRAMGIDPRTGADLPVEAGEPDVQNVPTRTKPAVTVTRTQKAIGTQIEEAAATLGLACSAVYRDGGMKYDVAGRFLTPSEAADYLLAGGFKEAYGRAETVVHPDRLAERDAAGDVTPDWEARIGRLLPFCKPGADFRRAVVEAVTYARMKLETGGDPTLDVVEGEIAAGWRPREHRAMAARGEALPPVEPAEVSAPVEPVVVATVPEPRRVSGSWAALLVQ